MPEKSSARLVPGLQQLREQTSGVPEICVAVLDGVVDQAHPCFSGARIERLSTTVGESPSTGGGMSTHGTHVASLIFGQPGSPVEGTAPNCRGLLIPCFSDARPTASQLDLARGVEQAVEAGAHIINISGGQLTDDGEADDLLERAVRLCRDRDVLLVAAAGNDGCACVHVPAALSAVLAVGAADHLGRPSPSSNWGAGYRGNGILAPGENILGAKPGGGTVRLSGTSFAAPIVSGVAALLLSLQQQRGQRIAPNQVRRALLETASPCELPPGNERRRCLAGVINVSGALAYITNKSNSSKGERGMSEENVASVEASGCNCAAPPSVSEPAQPVHTSGADAPVTASVVTRGPANGRAQAVRPSQDSASSGGGMVYAIGTLGYDFGTEARRDTFKQLMSPVAVGDTSVPANPYDGRQMVDYLKLNLSEAKSLIWTLNLELTPIYALEPEGSFARDVYAAFQEFLSGEVQAEDSAGYIERVSIPGRLTGRTVRLFSGQVVPVVAPESPRGLYGWKVNMLVGAALEAVNAREGGADERQMRRSLTSFLDRIYYDLRNLGTTSQDRALNFAATNAFQAAQAFSSAVAAGMELDSITVTKSPFCRMDSDCWDVQLKFFDPENNQRAKRIFRFTIDVSDLMPVSLGEVRTWTSPY